jgi:hypothetical protein
MGRPGMMLHRKTRRLARELDEFQAGFGPVLARGVLELLWDGCYENGDAYLGDATDVEARAGWGGRAGVLVTALVEAGGPGHAGFIDEGGTSGWPEGEPGTYRVHDLFDHCPDYVAGRQRREDERKKEKVCLGCGAIYRSPDPRAKYHSHACRTAAWRNRHEPRDGSSDGVTDGDGVRRNGGTTVTHGDGTPAPAPAPYTGKREEASPPAPADDFAGESETPEEAATKAARVTAHFQKNRVPGLAWSLADAYQEVRGEKYAHGGAKDTKALGRLVKIADNAEINRRWRHALALGSKWPGCSTFAGLASKWNDLAAPAGGNGRSGPELLDLCGTDENGFTIYGKGTP